jgi:energy-coupling factor transport system ATP-binding protein
VLKLEAAGYRYAGGDRLALRDVSLEVDDGDVLGVAGPSGAGKSTLCLVAAGLAPRVVGGELSGRRSAEGEVGIAFQNPATQLIGVAETVYEEVAFGASNLGVALPELITRVEEALQALEIAELASREPARLSGGQQQLVAIAGLLAMRPAHLVLDEPTAQLDPAGTRLVADALRRLAGSGVAILVTEQKTDLLLEMCGRVIVLDAGAVALDGMAAEVLADARLRSLGVAEPASLRLRRLAAERGLDPASFDAAWARA